MEINLLFFLTVVPAIILYGIAKSGLGGSMTLISVPLMTIVMPLNQACLLYTSPSPRDRTRSRMPSSA